MRKTQFAIDEYYHIFNRGVDKRNVFLDEYDYLRFLKSAKEFNVSRPIGSLYQLSFKEKNEHLGTKSPIGDLVPKCRNLVEIVCYCLNSNHYHFILKQLEDNGISKFMLKLSSGYTSYFNKKYSRSGSLFQGPFKSTHIDSNEMLLYLSVYVNANHQIHNYPEKDWKYSSFPDYIGKRKDDLCNKESVFGQFDNDFGEYKKYADVNMNYFKEKKEMEKYILE